MQSLPDHVPHPAPYPVTFHGTPDGPSDNESHAGRRLSLPVTSDHVDNEATSPRPTTSSNRECEVLAAPHSRSRRQHNRCDQEFFCLVRRKHLPDTALDAVRQPARRVRPLRRRAATIARPDRVRMRSRKPCVLARRRLFGWNVRLLTGGSDSRGDPVSTPAVGALQACRTAAEEVDRRTVRPVAPSGQTLTER